jgi:hypothetical protein
MTSYVEFLRFFQSLNKISLALASKTEQKYNPSPRFVSDVNVYSDGRVIRFTVNIRVGKVWSNVQYSYSPGDCATIVKLNYNCVEASADDSAVFPSASQSRLHGALVDFVVDYLRDYDMQPEHLDEHVLDLLIKAGRVQAVTTYKLKG